MVKLNETSIFAHAVEWWFLVAQKIFRWIKFYLFTVRKNKNFGVVHDGVEPMRDRDDGALGELVLDGRLDERVSLQVNGRGGLVQHQDLRLP